MGGRPHERCSNAKPREIHGGGSRGDRELGTLKSRFFFLVSIWRVKGWFASVKEASKKKS
jgi:hypothetical protein